MRAPASMVADKDLPKAVSGKIRCFVLWERG